MSKVKKNFSILEIPQFILEWVVVAMVIVINPVISEFGWVDFWLPQMSNYRCLITANCPFTIYAIWSQLYRWISEK